MNKQNRKDLQRAASLIDEAKLIIEEIGDGETDKYDNLPEGFQIAERGETFSSNAFECESIVSNLDDAISEVEELCNS